jgi:diguanylate cyclase (GGDEF)-like protein
MGDSQPNRVAAQADGANTSLRALLARVEQGAATAAERVLLASPRQPLVTPVLGGPAASTLHALTALLPRLLHERSGREGVAPARALGERAYEAGVSLPEVLVAAARLQDHFLQEVTAEWRESDRLAVMALLHVSGILHELSHEATLAYVERATQTLRAQARSDGLTGLANRRAFDERLDEERARAARLPHTFAVVLLDLDGLKQINDTRGHAPGDRALMTLARTLHGQARGIDLVARIGGDEFALVLPEADRAGAHAFVDRLVRAVGREVVDGQALSVSAGVALSPDDGGDVAALLRHADRALYRAKRRR